jgi:molybdenum cofactor cytidylyltransferase
MSIGAVILAAGRGSRMGLPKWQLRLSSGQFFYQYLLNQFKDLGCETVIVVNSDDYELLKHDKQISDIKIVRNNRVDLGRLYSLQCGLRSLSENKHCFVQNIDNPFICEDLLATLKSGITHFDYALPEFDGRGGHPLLIKDIIAKQILQYHEQFPDLREVLGIYKGNRIPYSNPNILQNINTPEDYERFLLIE